VNVISSIDSIKTNAILVTTRTYSDVGRWSNIYHEVCFKDRKFIDILMSFSTLIGFCSTFTSSVIHQSHKITVSTTMWERRVSQLKITSYVITGFHSSGFFTSLVFIGGQPIDLQASDSDNFGKESGLHPHNAHVLSHQNQYNQNLTGRRKTHNPSTSSYEAKAQL